MRQRKTFHISHRKNPSRENLNTEHLCPNTRASSYVIETLLKLKSYIRHHTLIVGDLNSPLWQLDRSVRQKMNREIREPTDVMTQMDLTDIYRGFQPKIKEYTFFLEPHWTFSKTDHILGNKTNLNRYKKLE